MIASQLPIRIATRNGLAFGEFAKDVFACNGVSWEDHVVEDQNNPDIVIFGPYGNDVPPAGRCIRVGYICEKVRYDGPVCDYLFTVSPHQITGIKTLRIQWHGISPKDLVKPADFDAEAVMASKDRFCAYIYGNCVPYREEVFRRLSKYKRVDAPGRSMNNMPSIDTSALPGDNRWETKRRFLSRYKFTLALENEVFSGYQTEKLYDAMRIFSIPIYMGDPNIGEVFNTKSFINIALKGEAPYWIKRLEDFSQLRWWEIVGKHRHRLDTKVRKKLRRLARDLSHKWLLSKVADSLVDRVVELDRNDDLYLEMLREPWLKDNIVAKTLFTAVWDEIFAKARSSQSSLLSV